MASGGVVKQASLLDLPAEIRNMIYKYSLKSDDGIVVLDPEPEDASQPEAYHLPDLLNTSASVWAEAASIYYGINTFHARKMCTAVRFVERLAPKHQRMLQRLVIVGRGDVGFELSECWRSSISRVVGEPVKKLQKKGRLGWGVIDVRLWLDLRISSTIEIDINDLYNWEFEYEGGCVLGWRRCGWRAHHGPGSSQLQDRQQSH